MEVVRSIAQCRAFVLAQRRRASSIGFVPTMGALHEGHLSLVRHAGRECGLVVLSVFVNPTQFGPHEDFARYPRDLERDAALASSAGAHALFAPSVAEMYPEGYATCVLQEGQTIGCLEGQFRPGHFRGVLTVVAKLLNVVQPDRAYFGQKDYQQALVVRRMVRDLDMPMEIVVCETVREPDGLAMSSRNQYLGEAARRQATCIWRGFEAARVRLAAGECRAAALVETVRQTILAAGPCEIDYVAIADPETLAPVATIGGPCVVLAAVRIGGTRLIDNVLLAP
jgi:pantoate--beta-alanine ligase